MIGVVSAASTLQRGKSGRMDAALVEANEALEAAHQAKQAAEEALAECVAKLAHLEEAPPKVLAGRILTLKNLKVNNVPDLDAARGNRRAESQPGGNARLQREPARLDAPLSSRWSAQAARAVR